MSGCGISKKNLTSDSLSLVIEDPALGDLRGMEEEEEEELNLIIVDPDVGETAGIPETATSAPPPPQQEPQFRVSDTESKKEYFTLESVAEQEARELEEYRKEGIGSEFPNFSCEICRLIRFKMNEAAEKNLSAVMDIWDVGRLDCDEEGLVSK